MLVIAGKGSIAVGVLQDVFTKRTKEVCVVTNKNEAESHGWQPSIRLYCQEHGIPIVNLEEAMALTDSTFLSLEFDTIVRPERFKSNRLYNIHLSDLPSYKGMYTSVWPILNNDPHGGVTLHCIDRGIDTGNIIAKRCFRIQEHFTSRMLLMNNYRIGTQLCLDEISSLLESSKVIGDSQPSHNSSYYSKTSIDFTSVSIDFNASAFDVEKKVRAFAFREFQFIKYRDHNIVRAEICDSRSKKSPGTQVGVYDNGFVVSTIDYDIYLFIDLSEKLANAVKCNRISDVRALLSNISYIDDPISHDWTPLMMSCYWNTFHVTELLLERGADVNAKSGRGTSVTMYASTGSERTGDYSSLSLCLENRPNVDVMDYKNKTVYEYCNDRTRLFIQRKVEQ